MTIHPAPGNSASNFGNHATTALDRLRRVYNPSSTDPLSPNRSECATGVLSLRHPAHTAADNNQG